jgi:hypothetical protein
LSHRSDDRRSLTYVGIDPLTFPSGILPEPPVPARYEGTFHVQGIVGGERTSIAWSVALDAAPEDAGAWRELLQAWIPAWTDSLGRALARNNLEDG